MTDKIVRSLSTEVKEEDVRINSTRRQTAAAVTKASRGRSNKIVALTEVRAKDYCNAGTDGGFRGGDGDSEPT